MKENGYFRVGYFSFYSGSFIILDRTLLTTSNCI